MTRPLLGRKGVNKRVLVLSDMQIYWHAGKVAGLDLKTWRAVLSFVKEFRWDEVVQVGDFLDLNCISHHNKDNLRAIEGERIQKDFEAGGMVLDELRGAIGKKCKITIISGNHEHRMEKLIDQFPALEGMLEIEKGLKLKERKINYVDFWARGEMYSIGKATFVHGPKKTGGEIHSKKMVSHYGCNIFYGHTHDIQCYSWEMKGDNKTIVGQSLGCLCVYDLPYMQGRPSKWQQGFAVFEFAPDGFFTYNLVRIFKHRFMVNGKTYQG